jgi:hypothetical protein
MITREQNGLLVQLLARDALARVADDLAQVEVTPMPLKSALIVALGIRRAADRPMVDLDILVSPQHARSAVRRLRARGWIASIGNDYSCSITHPRTTMPVDLHRALFPPHFFRMDPVPVLARGVSDRQLFGVPVLRMQALDLFAHLVGHFVKGRADRRDLDHLHDFAAVAKWSGVTASACARHLSELGLARAARYALGLARSELGDDFAGRVLRELPADTRGVGLARLASGVLGRTEAASKLGIPFVHALNASCWQGTRSLLSHITEPRGEDCSRDGWWRS